MRHIYTVAFRYVVEETFEIEAESAADAIEEMWGTSDSTWERIKNFKPRVVAKKPVLHG